MNTHSLAASRIGGWELESLSGPSLRPKKAISPKPLPHTDHCHVQSPDSLASLPVEVHPSSRDPCRIGWSLCCYGTPVNLLPLPTLASLTGAYPQNIPQ